MHDKSELMVVVSDGTRFFFSLKKWRTNYYSGSGYGSYSNSYNGYGSSGYNAPLAGYNDRPQAFTLRSMKMAPQVFNGVDNAMRSGLPANPGNRTSLGPVPAMSITSCFYSSNTYIFSANFDSTEKDYHSHSSLIGLSEVNKNEFPNVVSPSPLLAKAMGVNSDLLAHQRVSSLDLLGKVWDIQEILHAHKQVSLTASASVQPGTNLNTSTATSSSSNELVTQHTQRRRQFLVLCSNGILVLTKRRPIDQLHDFLYQHPIPDPQAFAQPLVGFSNPAKPSGMTALDNLQHTHAQLWDFIDCFGGSEACAMCMSLAIGWPKDLSDASGLRMAAVNTIKTIRGYPQRIHTNDVDQVKVEHSFYYYGFCKIASRFLRDVWEKTVFVDANSKHLNSNYNGATTSTAAGVSVNSSTNATRALVFQDWVTPSCLEKMATPLANLRKQLQSLQKIFGRTNPDWYPPQRPQNIHMYAQTNDHDQRHSQDGQHSNPYLNLHHQRPPISAPQLGYEGDDLLESEDASFHEIYSLIQRSIEGLELLEILRTQRVSSVVPGLASSNFTFRMLVSTKEGGDCASAMIADVLSNALAERDVAATENSLNNAKLNLAQQLYAKCPSYFTKSDLLLQQGLGKIVKMKYSGHATATENGGSGESRVATEGLSSVPLFVQDGGLADLFNAASSRSCLEKCMKQLRDVVNQLVQHQRVRDVVHLVLRSVESIDRLEAPFATHEEAIQLKIWYCHRCLDTVVDNLDVLVHECDKDGPGTQRSARSVGAIPQGIELPDPAKMQTAQELIALADQSGEYRLQEKVYAWLLKYLHCCPDGSSSSSANLAGKEKASLGRLLWCKTQLVVNVSHPNVALFLDRYDPRLLCDWLVAHNQYLKAGTMANKLAQEESMGLDLFEAWRHTLKKLISDCQLNQFAIDPSTSDAISDVYIGETLFPFVRNSRSAFQDIEGRVLPSAFYAMLSRDPEVGLESLLGHAKWSFSHTSQSTGSTPAESGSQTKVQLLKFRDWIDGRVLPDIRGRLDTIVMAKSLLEQVKNVDLGTYLRDVQDCLDVIALQLKLLQRISGDTTLQTVGSDGKAVDILVHDEETMDFLSYLEGKLWLHGFDLNTAAEIASGSGLLVDAFANYLQGSNNHGSTKFEWPEVDHMASVDWSCIQALFRGWFGFLFQGETSGMGQHADEGTKNALLKLFAKFEAHLKEIDPASRYLNATWVVGRSVLPLLKQKTGQSFRSENLSINFLYLLLVLFGY
jgi:hypothetical protein